MSSGRHARPSRSRRTAAVAAAVIPAAAAAGTILVPGTAQAAVPVPHAVLAPSSQAAVLDAVAAAPAAPGVWHVRPGDTLSVIGAAVHIPWPQLWAANASKIRNPDLIYPGQQLIEEAGKVTPAEAAVLSPPPAASAAPPVHEAAAAVTHSAPPPPAASQSLSSLQAYAERLVGASQFTCLNELWNRESGWRVTVWNTQGSGAYGIPQALPGDKMASAGPDWQTNGYTQIRWGVGYVDGSYGSACGAWSHEESFGWY